MNTVSQTWNVSLTAKATGISGNTTITNSLAVSDSSSQTESGTGSTLCNQIYNKADTLQTLTAASTTTIDLTAPGTNPLNESIASSPFVKIRTIYFSHDSTSTASSVTIFNAAANPFQGPLTAAATITLPPGSSVYLKCATLAGWAVAAGTKNFKILNNDGVNVALVKYYFAGSTT